jgi:hypothetical protein
LEIFNWSVKNTYLLLKGVRMTTFSNANRRTLKALPHSILSLCALALLGTTVALSAAAQPLTLQLTGAQQVPAVVTSATGNGVITVGADKSVIGSVTVSGLEPTMAHIHEGAAPNANGPVIVPMAKTADNVWSVPAGAKLTDAQFESFKKGHLYVNVHSVANKAGEIRAQLKP